MTVIDCHAELACPGTDWNPEAGKWTERPHVRSRFLTVRWYSKRGYEVSVFPEECLERSYEASPLGASTFGLLLYDNH
jgi:hypothetical protein